MSSAYLPIYRQNATLELMDTIPRIQSNHFELNQFLAACKWYRIKAICTLLIEAKPEPFLLDLHKSGRTFLYFLHHASLESKLTSQAAPFFDSVASRDFKTAKAIAEKSSPTWNQEEEFEEDFLYVWFLMSFFFFTPSESNCLTILERYEKLVGALADPRFDICKAFLSKNNDNVINAIIGIIELHQKTYAKIVGNELVSPEEAKTEPYICIEALALINLAERRGFVVNDEFVTVPSLIRGNGDLIYSETDWIHPQ